MSNQYPGGNQSYNQYPGGNQPPPPNDGGFGFQQPHQGGYPQGNPALAEDTGASGFFQALFDFSFSHFITPKVVKFVYVLATVVLVLGWVVVLISAFAKSAGMGVLVLIVGPIVVLLYLIFIRITLEFYLATVRMSEDIHQRLPRR